MQVDGTPARKPSHPVEPGTDLVVEADGPRWVGRAAHKLLAALELWEPAGLTAVGRRCIDVGASTGGFTQVLLARGATHVVALDVGHGQLAREVAEDPRVSERSNTTVRGLAAPDVGGPFDLVVADLSFISLTRVAVELAGLTGRGGDLVVLVKPQFEVGRRRHGVVTTTADRVAAVEGVLHALEEQGLHPHGVAASPITGTTGNAEYLVWARWVPSDTMADDEVRAAVRAATEATAGGAR